MGSFCRLSRLLKNDFIIKKIPLIVLLFSLAFFLAGLEADAQKITFSRENVPLEEIFKEIQKQTGYDFLYTAEMLKGTRPVDVQFKGTSVEDALKHCINGQLLTFTINKKTVVIRRKKGEEV